MEFKVDLSAEQKKANIFTLIALATMIVGSLGLDQITKNVAEENLLVWADQENLKEYQGRRYPVWSLGQLTSPIEDQSFFLGFNFNYVRNQGAAWGFLSDWDDAYRIPFFYIVTFLAVIIIGMYLRTTPLSHRLARFALALILSGALGNFTDRLFRGYVVDFLDFRWVFPFPFSLQFSIDFLNFQVNANSWRYNFPNFNWADSVITVGVMLLLYDMLILERLRKNNIRSD